MEPSAVPTAKDMALEAKVDSCFNNEEFLFLNRVAFYLLSSKGANIEFKDFITTLTQLQDGIYEDKIELVCEMLKNGRDTAEYTTVDELV